MIHQGCSLFLASKTAQWEAATPLAKAVLTLPATYKPSREESPHQAERATRSRTATNDPIHRKPIAELGAAVIASK
jgi:hypothetical protein